MILNRNTILPAAPAAKPVQYALKALRRDFDRVFTDTAAPGGRILLQGYTPKQLEYRTGGPSAVENLYTPEILREAFADWTMEELVEYEEDVNEGAGHRGRSALIGLVARKP